MEDFQTLVHMQNLNAATVEENLELASAGTVGDYYDVCQFWYRAFYSDRVSLGVHYGIWPRSGMARVDALIEPYRIALDELRPKPGDWLLDAGCGIGGASRWLALNSAARFTGISVSPIQIARARRHIARRGLAGRVDFHCMDYHRTSFSDARFDHVFGIESFCYSYPTPSVLFRELHRVLKPGGRLVMLDGILRRWPANRAEQHLADAFSAGFSMRGWNTADQIMQSLRETGFRHIHFTDQTPFIEPSVEDIHRRHLLFRHLRHFRPLVPAEVIQSLEGTAVQREMYRAGLFGYALFSAEKQ